jgi:hypothetical protein
MLTAGRVCAYSCQQRVGPCIVGALSIAHWLSWKPVHSLFIDITLYKRVCIRVSMLWRPVYPVDFRSRRGIRYRTSKRIRFRSRTGDIGWFFQATSCTIAPPFEAVFASLKTSPIGPSSHSSGTATLLPFLLFTQRAK